jgi:hypothetical protein
MDSDIFRNRRCGMKVPTVALLVGVIGVMLLPALSAAQAVLGPCGGTEGAENVGTAEAQQQAYAPKAVEVSRVPLPGERAIDFELTAVVGDEIKRIKLSDYQGMYRVLCFYPADFTFV